MTPTANLDLWSLLACPECLGPLARRADAVLACEACSSRFAPENGRPSLVPPRKRPMLDRLSRDYRQARLQEGWRPLSRTELLSLPRGAPEGYPPLYWPVRRQTYKILQAFLDDADLHAPTTFTVDAGAGTGWLSFRLAQRGHKTLALDASLDDDFGLGASAPFVSRYPERLLPVRGDLDTLPLRPGAAHLILFNASLHYNRDPSSTLRRAASALAPAGHLLILDTPIYLRPRSGSTDGVQRMARRALAADLSAAGLEVHVKRIFRGFRWLAYQARHLLRGCSLFSFPVLIGTKPSQEDEAP